ncbi:hypothetical protein O3P69_020190 [Scylla paramamosain]|uniref:Enkurin domain-containing protein n=1 Tax=Scylla paramamosain TaxID=85552 RepID=A0AAW0TM16_SCYPA
MENLVSRISSQRPACEMDYHQHYRTIENQHRQLLDAVERINSSSGDAGSGEDSTRSRGGQARAATPPRMVRAYSFDRSTQARRREGSAERKSKAGAPGELKALKKFHHRSSSPSPSSSFSSPQPVRSSRMISKSGRSLQDTGEGKGVSGRQVVGVKGNVMTESISKDELRGKRTLMRAKSELGRASPDIQPSGTRPPSRHGSLWSNAKQDAGDAASFSEDTNLNSTLSSSCDFYPGGHVDTESPRRATREDLKLAIRPDSQSTTAGGNHGAKDPNQNDWDSGADAENAAVHPDAVEAIQHSEPPGGQTDGTMGEKITGTEDRKIDDPGGLDETDDAHRAQTVATSTPVQNIGEDDGATAAVTTTTHSPRRLKREQQQPRRTRGDPLRRSQSLKNVAHTPGEPPPSYQIGKIPRYLQIRKEEKRRQEELALAVDPDCPPGHQPLPDHERLNTLHLLHKSQTQVLRELSSLPVAQDTLRIKKVRLTLEEKLTQIEEGLRIFSQPLAPLMVQSRVRVDGSSIQRRPGVRLPTVTPSEEYPSNLNTILNNEDHEYEYIKLPINVNQQQYKPSIAQGKQSNCSENNVSQKFYDTLKFMPPEAKKKETKAEGKE